MILFIWWVRWIQQRKIWSNWVWIRLIWCLWHRIGWFFAWCRISFRCHFFCWWVMWWWWMVNFYTITKYCWSGYQRRCKYQMYRRLQYLFYCTNIVWIMDWSHVCQISGNGLIWFSVIWINVNRVGIFLIPNYRNFVLNFFNFEIIFALIIFEKYVATKVFTFFFFCAMPRRSPAGKFWNPDYWVEDVEATLTGTGNMWAWYFCVSWWVCSKFFIRVSLEINTHFVTTFPTPKGELLITVSLSINVSASLVRMHNNIFSQLFTTYNNIFRPYSYLQQQ